MIPAHGPAQVQYSVSMGWVTQCRRQSRETTQQLSGGVGRGLEWGAIALVSPLSPVVEMTLIKPLKFSGTQFLHLTRREI